MNTENDQFSFGNPLCWLVRNGKRSQPVGSHTDHVNPQVGDMVYQTPADFEKSSNVIEKGKLIGTYVQGRRGPTYQSSSPVPEENDF